MSNNVRRKFQYGEILGNGFIYVSPGVGYQRTRKDWFICPRCKQEAFLKTTNIRKGKTKACCRESLTTPAEKRPLYASWKAMKGRCLNPKATSYRDYGGRGITVCDRWLTFTLFEEDMQKTHEAGLQIDRIDNDAGYFLENCRWVTPKENTRNRRNNTLVTYAGETRCLSAWVEVFPHLSVSNLSQRFFKGDRGERLFRSVRYKTPTKKSLSDYD